MAPGRRRWRTSRHLGSEADQATFRTLHTASLASRALREGLTAESVERSLRHLRALLGGPGRDTARGGSGRDRCRAEVERACER